MTLHIVDVSRHQVERPDPLDLARAKAAGFTIANIQLDRGRQDDILPAWAPEYAAEARQLGMGVSTYRWLDARIPGAESARRAFARMAQLGGPAGMAHVVDCEDTATEQHLRDYVTTMVGLLGRPIAIYSGRWWLQPRGWHIADLSPYLWAAPSAGYLDSYPGDSSPHWTVVAYGGYTTLAAMQYAVTPLPGTGPCSLSAIRDPTVWNTLTGGGRVPLKPDKHITDEHCRFINEVEMLEPADTGALYPYVRQAGYHGSRNDQYALGRSNDYSIRSADDKAGPGDKTAAFDWISESARLRGDHTVMYKYARRIRDAFNARDPRLKGWREWLTYLDGKLIGFDFVGWYTRLPNSSHSMHHHLSKLRRYTTDWTSYAAMLSILAGESLATWQAGTSRYQEQTPPAVLDEEDDMRLIRAGGADGKIAYALVTGFEARVYRREDLGTTSAARDSAANLFAKVCGQSSAIDADGDGWNALMAQWGIRGHQFVRRPSDNAWVLEDRGTPA